MAQQTPDLKKLEEKFEDLFKEETEESFNKWLTDKQQNIKPNNMAQQTAVDIFYEQIDDIIPDALRERIELFKEQAKEMEKQHKEAFWIAGLVYLLKVLKAEENANSKEAFEQYYNKTYNK